jgi:hypothetical protein
MFTSDIALKSIRVTKLLMTNVGCFRKRFSSVRGFDLDHKIRVDDKIDKSPSYILLFDTVRIGEFSSM